jgi:deoxycytidylate deaminase
MSCYDTSSSLLNISSTETEGDKLSSCDNKCVNDGIKSGSNYSSSTDVRDDAFSFLSPSVFGWKPCHSLTEHENFMDLVLLVTRSSQLKQGSMACILVSPPVTDDIEGTNNNVDNIENNNSPNRKRYKTSNDGTILTDRIITIATNQSFYKENESDIHAEVVAISQVANRLSLPIPSTLQREWDDNRMMMSTNATTIPCTTQNATAYITMPPCKRCFAALVTAGIKRIVSRYPSASAIQTIAAQKSIEMIVIPENRSRIQTIIHTYRHQQNV